MSMTTMETATDGIVHLTFEGDVRAKDIENATTLIEKALHEHERVSGVIEVKDLKGISLAAMLKDLSFAFRHIRDFYRFERFAVITDLNWLTQMAKWENQIFWQVDIKTFSPAEKEEALAWVNQVIPEEELGVVELPTDRANLLAFRLEGKVNGIELRRMRQHLHQAANDQGGVDLLVIMPTFPQIGQGVISEKTRMLSLLQVVRKYAVVAGDWAHPMITALNPLFKMEIKHFGLDQETEARAWLEKK